MDGVFVCMQELKMVWGLMIKHYVRGTVMVYSTCWAF
jgi:hypothetical protein